MPDGYPSDRRTVSPLLNLPNIVAFGRLCAVPAAFWLVLFHRIGEAFVLFAVAGLPDALDGWLARRYGDSAIGAFMNPVADKALLVQRYTTLASIGRLPYWLAIGVVFRDLLIAGAVLTVLGHPVTIKSLYNSAMSTVLQILFIAICLLQAGFGLLIRGLSDAMTWCVDVTTLASGATYVWDTARGE